MNLREGRSGRIECTYTIATALIMCGLFIFESDAAYKTGNSTYFSLPIACILAFVVFLLCTLAMNKTRTSDLNALAQFAFGNIGAYAFGIYFSTILTLITCSLLNKFVNVLYSYYYQEADFFSICFYLFATLVVLSVMGFETINRVSKVVGVLLILILLLLFINSASGYDVYKIYPIAGDGARHMTIYSLRSIVYFLPALLSALITAKGMHGTKSMCKNCCTAVLIAAIVCFVTQTLLAFSYTYDELASLYIPLFRMSMVTGVENFVVRLDKLGTFIWLAGALVASCYYTYSASLIFSESFRQKDIRPSAITISFITVALCLLAHSGRHTTIALLNLLEDYGSLLLCVPLAFLALVSLVKGRRKADV